MITKLKEMLVPERTDELRTIVDNYQRKRKKSNRIDSLLMYCRMTMLDCIRNGDMFIVRAADGTEACMGKDVLPGGTASSHEGKRNIRHDGRVPRRI